MPAFMQLSGVPGESTDKKHKDWILIESMSSPIYRSIAEGAKDQQRSRGETTLGDVVVVRELDKSSVKLQENCANGTYFPEVKINFCTQVNNVAEPYLMYVLKNVIITSYSVHANASGDPIPSEEITMNYTAVDWSYMELDNATGSTKGTVPGSFNLGMHSNK